jgi:hypothetical protein
VSRCYLLYAAVCFLLRAVCCLLSGNVCRGVAVLLCFVDAGPHMMEEWWVSSGSQSGPEDLPSWQRPFKRFRAVPHDVWLMAQPVTYGEEAHLWVSDTAVYQLPLYRLTGVYAPANGECQQQTTGTLTLQCVFCSD